MDCKDCWSNVIDFIDINSYQNLININKKLYSYTERLCKQFLVNRLYNFNAWTNSYVVHYKIQLMYEKFRTLCESHGENCVYLTETKLIIV